MRHWTVLFLCFLSVHLMAQSTYFDYDDLDKTAILTENFDQHSNVIWTGNEGTYKGEIRNGYYYWETSRSTSMYAPITLKLEETKDYEIETRIKLVNGVDNFGQSLIWNMNTQTGDAYYFNISNNQYFQITRYKDNYDDYVEWTYSTTIKKDDFNYLTVRKVRGNMYFFINTVLVHTMAAEPLFGEHAAISVPKQSKLQVDYINAYYLKKDKYLEMDKGKGLDITQYGAYTSSDRETVFFDDFSDNRKNWWQGNDESNWAKIENGHLYWQSKAATSRYLPYNLAELDENKDFEIELRIKFVRGAGQDNGFGLLWGKPRDHWKSYTFYCTNTGYYRIFKNQEDAAENYVPWTESNLVNADAYNIITVRKVARTYYFFVNKQLVHSMPFQSFMGDQFAIETPKQSTVFTDYVRISHLNKKKLQAENIPPSIVITSPTVARGFKVVEVDTETTRIAGIAHDSDGISEVLINGKRANIQPDGVFSANIELHTGSNSVLVKATDSRNKSTIKSFTIDHTKKTRVTQNEKRLALVIGNGNYSHGGSLKNPTNDANGMKVALEQLGFEVMKYENCDQRTMKKAIDDFGKKLEGYDVALFFYAGHGLQVNGRNYLIPTDASLSNEDEVEYDCVRADRVLMVMEASKAKTNLIILDACRNNPFARSWSRGSDGGGGLAFMNAPKGSLIAYATSPGNTASDGAGDNGLYTEALLKEITKPNITILEMFQNVRAKVVTDSDNSQTPWESTSLIGNFYLKKE